jgi:hypothetical protein
MSKIKYIDGILSPNNSPSGGYFGEYCKNSGLFTTRVCKQDRKRYLDGQLCPCFLDDIKHRTQTRGSTLKRGDGMRANMSVKIDFNDLMKAVAWYIALPLFVGLLTEFQWAVLTFFIVSIVTSVGLAYAEDKPKSSGRSRRATHTNPLKPITHKEKKL